MRRATTLEGTMDLHTDYDEHWFCSLLDLEHRRCLQSGHASHVLLCRFATQDGVRFPMDQSSRRALVSAVRESLHQTDQTGWFLQDLVSGVLLLNRDSERSAVSRRSETDRIRRQIEGQLSLDHPSLVVQFYEYLDLPPMQQPTWPGTTTQVLIRHDEGGHYAMCTLYRHESTGTHH